MTAPREQSLRKELAMATVTSYTKTAVDALLSDISYPVESVAGKTGNVDLTADDVNAIPTTADVTDIVKITQDAYDALGSPSATTLYVIVG